MTFLRSLPDRWRCWWRGPLPEPCECDVLSRACAQALHVIDGLRAERDLLTDERDRAVRDLRDVLGLRSRNDVMSMLRPEENDG